MRGAQLISLRSGLPLGVSLILFNAHTALDETALLLMENSILYIYVYMAFDAKSARSERVRGILYILYS